jgi:hypothetical protein
MSRARVPYYPPSTEFPRRIPKIRRSSLTEIRRRGVQVDLVSYRRLQGQAKLVAFKYYMNDGNVSMFWNEINGVMRIPEHPSIVPFDALVIEPLDGEDKVVGFTTVYTPGGTISDNPERVFKLKYLKQLIEGCCSMI